MLLFLFKKKNKNNLPRTNKTKQRRLILLYFCSKVHSDRSTGYPFAICFQVYSFIPSRILAPSISEEEQLYRCSINKLYNLLEEGFCLFFLCYHIFPVLSFSTVSTKLSQVQLQLAFVYMMCSTL